MFELESHLRDSVDDLATRGVSEEEAFLVSVRRMGDAQALGDEFAKITTESLWRQLLVPAPDERTRRRNRNEALLVNLALLAVGYGRFLAGRGRYQRIVDLQMRYLPLYAAWAAVVIVVFPPLFGFE